MNELKVALIVCIWLAALIVVCIWLAEAGRATGAWLYPRLRRTVLRLFRRSPRGRRIDVIVFMARHVAEHLKRETR